MVLYLPILAFLSPTKIIGSGQYLLLFIRLIASGHLIFNAEKSSYIINHNVTCHISYRSMTI